MPGTDPQVAINGNTVVEVHRVSDDAKDPKLFNSVGSIDSCIIKWGCCQQSCRGRNPAIAVNSSGDVVQVFQSAMNNMALFCMVGKVDAAKTIVAWESMSHDMEECGENARVAINDSRNVVMVFQRSRSLFYRLGELPESSCITWQSSCCYDKGIYPAIAINNSGCAVECHRSPHHNTLWYRVGVVRTEKKEIIWGGLSQKFDRGIYPSVALNDYGDIVGCHQSERYRKLWHNIGSTVPGHHNIIWNCPKKYADGFVPAVAINSERIIVVVHGVSKTQIGFKVGKISQ